MGEEVVVEEEEEVVVVEEEEEVVVVEEEEEEVVVVVVVVVVMAALLTMRVELKKKSVSGGGVGGDRDHDSNRAMDNKLERRVNVTVRIRNGTRVLRYTVIQIDNIMLKMCVYDCIIIKACVL